MPKPAQDLRVPGYSFEQAVKRMIATPPVPSGKPARAKKPVRRKK